MVLIAVDFTYLYALWDSFFIYFATVVLAYGCGLAHGIIGILLMQYFRKKRPTSSTQTDATIGDKDQAQPDHSRNASANAPANASIPDTIWELNSRFHRQCHSQNV